MNMLTVLSYLHDTGCSIGVHVYNLTVLSLPFLSMAAFTIAGCREAFREADGLSKLVTFIGNKVCNEILLN